MRHLTGLALAGPLLALPAAAWAHQGIHEDLHWSWDAGVLAGLAIAAIWYGRGVMALSRAGRLGQVAGPAQITLFVAGMAVVFLALESPLDALSDRLFSAHMVQHLLLSVVAAPLFAYRRQTGILLWGLGPRLRRPLLRGWRRGMLGKLGHALLHPILVWTAFCATFVFWHIPGPYRWALADKPLHALEHLCFLVAPLAFWAIVFDRSSRRRLDHGATLIFIVSAAVLSDLPGAVMLLASHAVYPVNALDTSAWGLTPLQDQQLAGATMWVPMGFAFLAAGCWVFADWMKVSEDREVRAMRQRQAASMVAVLLVAIGMLLTIGDRPATAAPIGRADGDSRRGAELIRHYGCGYCHTIPGIANASGRVGPPLTGFGERLYVAGMLPNTPDNLMTWIKDPQRIVPGNVMPVLGVSEQDARDIATYLYTLH